MSVSNVSMNAQGSRPQRKQPSNMPYVLTSMGVGAIGGGAYGYFKNNLVNKEGFYTDEFLSRVAQDFVKGDNEQSKQIKSMSDKFSQIFNKDGIDLKLTSTQKKFLDSLDPGIKDVISSMLNIPEIDETTVRTFIKDNADLLSIKVESGKNLDDAVTKYITERPKKLLNSRIFPEIKEDNFFKNLISEYNSASVDIRVPKKNSLHALRMAIFEDLQNAYEPVLEEIEKHKDIEWLSEHIDTFFDRKIKKFKQITEDMPKNIVDSLKKAAKEVNSTSVKLKNAAFLGGISLLAMGAVSSIIAMVTNKKS